MREIGLLDGFWLRTFKANVDRCQRKDESFKGLDLPNLTGAFVVLFAGYLASILCLLAEKLYRFIYQANIAN